MTEDVIVVLRFGRDVVGTYVRNHVLASSLIQPGGVPVILILIFELFVVLTAFTLQISILIFLVGKSVSRFNLNGGWMRAREFPN